MITWILALAFALFGAGFGRRFSLLNLGATLLAWAVSVPAGHAFARFFYQAGDSPPEYSQVSAAVLILFGFSWIFARGVLLAAVVVRRGRRPPRPGPWDRRIATVSGALAGALAGLTIAGTLALAATYGPALYLRPGPVESRLADLVIAPLAADVRASGLPTLEERHRRQVQALFGSLDAIGRGLPGLARDSTWQSGLDPKAVQRINGLALSGAFHAWLRELVPLLTGSPLVEEGILPDGWPEAAPARLGPLLLALATNDPAVPWAALEAFRVDQDLLALLGRIEVFSWLEQSCACRVETGWLPATVGGPAR